MTLSLLFFPSSFEIWISLWTQESDKLRPSGSKDGKEEAVVEVVRRTEEEGNDLEEERRRERPEVEDRARKKAIETRELFDQGLFDKWRLMFAILRKGPHRRLE